MEYKYFFPSLGLYGLEGIEDCVLAGLVSGDPVLLVGLHGSAKTLMCERLAESLGLKFHAYDASKALFEDVIGFPNPKKLMSGKVDYISTPISLWDKEFILIDEISRASPQMQNKWLEIIRSRRIMGKETTKLRFIFSAMNPPEYLGTIPLDAALAGRFAFIIKVPELKEMDIPAIASIIRHVDKVEASEIKSGKFKILKGVSKKIKNFISEVRKTYPKIEKKYNSEIEAYLLHLSGALILHNRVIDGRRISMMRRNIISLLSVKSCKTGKTEFTNYELNEYFFECLKYSLPYEVMGEKIPVETLREIHRIAFDVLTEKSEIVEARLDLSRTLNSFGLAEKLLKYYQILPLQDVEKYISEIINQLNAPREGLSSQIPALFGLLKIFIESEKIKSKLTPNILRNIIELSMSVVHPKLTRTYIDDLSNFFSTMMMAMSENIMKFKFDLNTIEGHLALKVIVNLSKGTYRSMVATEEFNKQFYLVMSLINHYLHKK